MTRRAAFAAFALVSLVAGCDSAKREQARVDSISADSMRASVSDLVADIDSTLRVDSVAADAFMKGKAPATNTKTKSGSTTKTPVILGRDSVHIGKAIAMPIVADTVKKPPPASE